MINKINIINFLIILIVFIISSNIAWLNPRPDFYVYRTIEFFPFFWQYNVDSSTELLSAAFFPEYFIENPIRMSRPGYPVIVNLISNISYFIINPFLNTNYLYYVGASYLLFKFILYYFSITLLTKLLLNYFKTNYVILINILVFFHYHSIFYATTFHTSELSFITPLICLTLFFIIKENYSIYKNIYFSLIVGILILCKPNYACYFTILVFSFINKYYLQSILSFFIHLLPICIYLLYLNYVNIEFYHYGIQGAGFLGWFFEASKVGVLNMFNELFLSILKYFENLFEYFHFFTISFILGLFYVYPRNKKIIIFFAILVFFIWLQIFSTNRWGGYMVADLTVPIMSLSVLFLINKISILENLKILISICILYLVINVASFVNLPWISPYNQNFQKYDFNTINNFNTNLN